VRAPAAAPCPGVRQPAQAWAAAGPGRAGCLRRRCPPPPPRRRGFHGTRIAG